jgi:hypothetical protein
MRVTRLGAVVLALLVASVALAFLGSGGLQVLGIATVIVIGLLLAGEGLSGHGGSMAAARKAEVARRRARPARRTDDDGAIAPSSEEQWARERERRARAPE